MLQKLIKIYHILQELRTLPKVRINMKCDSDSCRKLYGQIVKRHPRYLVIPNKALGVSLMDLNEFPDYHGFRGALFPPCANCSSVEPEPLSFQPLDSADLSAPKRRSH